MTKTTENKAMLTVRVSPKLKKKIESTAAQRFQSPSDLIREIMTIGVDQIEPRKRQAVASK